MSISLGLYRSYLPTIKQSKFEKRYEYIFNGKNRIYIPLDTKNFEMPVSNIQLRISNLLAEYGYKIDNYVQGTCKKRDCDDKRSFKIGKTLNMLINDLKKKNYTIFGMEEIVKETLRQSNPWTFINPYSFVFDSPKEIRKTKKAIERLQKRMECTVTRNVKIRITQDTFKKTIIPVLTKMGIKSEDIDQARCYFNVHGNKTVQDLYNEIKKHIEDFDEKFSIFVYDRINSESQIQNITSNLNAFNSDCSRNIKNANDLMICISRHPYDIIGMSTNRGWSSCMNHHGGTGMLHNVQADIKQGTIIAYLIYKNDTNIKNPVARINIKPYSNLLNKTVLNLPVQRIYGEPIKAFQNTINKFFYEKQKDLIKGCLRFSSKTGIYTDTLLPIYYTKMPKTKELIPETIFIKIKDDETSTRIQKLLFKIEQDLWHGSTKSKEVRRVFNNYLSNRDSLTTFRIYKNENHFVANTVCPAYNTDLVINPQKMTDKELITLISKFKKAKKTFNIDNKHISNQKNFYEYETACAKANMLPLIPEKKTKEAA